MDYANTAFDDLPIDFLLPADPALSQFFSRVPTSKPKLKPYAERKAEMIAKLHTLPLKTFYSKETLSNWSLPRLHKELKFNNVTEVNDGEKNEKDVLVEKLYNLNLREGESGSCSETCGICCLDYEDEEILRSLDCQHVFHVECIDKWALKSTANSKPPKCPMCNQQI